MGHREREKVKRYREGKVREARKVRVGWGWLEGRGGLEEQ